MIRTQEPMFIPVWDTISIRPREDRYRSKYCICVIARTRKPDQFCWRNGVSPWQVPTKSPVPI